MLLLIDNYDSFVHNLARYFERLGQSTRVVRNDQISVREVVAMSPDAVILSPGPRTPAEAGVSLSVVRELKEQLPILGVCLGHQTIAAAFGGKVVRTESPMHGRTSTLQHYGTGLFDNIPQAIQVCRYHSLTVESASLPDELRITATSGDFIMGIEHTKYLIFGVQFHPESVLTEYGYELLANFLRRIGLKTNQPEALSEIVHNERIDPPITNAFHL